MVLIKTLNKPRTCAQCRLKDFPHGECIVTGKKVSSWGMHTGVPQPTWCPLIAVEETEFGYKEVDRGDS